MKKIRVYREILFNGKYKDKIEKTGIINFLESNHENYKIYN